ncbi:MAG TPA: hypothetical protein PKD73_17415, partial [Burkholderiaceae bacterium]|nr:hypothetical protein [Burkholderiaceae bacterium]
MADFILKQLPCDLSNQAGLTLIGKYLKRIKLNALVDPRFPVRSGIYRLIERTAGQEGPADALARVCAGGLE